MAAAERAEASLSEFVRQGWHACGESAVLEWNWHHEAICLHLQAAFEDWARLQLRKMEPSAELERRASLLPTGEARQRFQNLLINIPPGTAKSRLASVMFPCWAWLRWPEWTVRVVSAVKDNVFRDAGYARDLLTSEWFLDTFQPDWGLRDDENARSNFRNTAGGQRISKPFMGRQTGGRTDCIIFDDPHDATEARSDPLREAVLTKWDTSLSNRVNDERTPVRIGIMQRLHEKDLSGHLLSQRWGEHLCIPLEYEGGPVCRCASCVSGTALGWRDPRRVVGEVVHAARFPSAVVAHMRKTLGSYGYSGQGQQRPAPAAGGMFPRKWWRWHSFGGVSPTRDGAAIARPDGCWDGPPVPTPPDGVRERRILSVDANFKEQQVEDSELDEAVLQVIDTVGAARFVRARLVCFGFPDTVRGVEAMVKDWAPDAVFIEDKANGPAIISTLKQKVTGVVPWNPGSDSKAARAAAMQPAMEAGDWFLPDGADWASDVVERFATFPRAKQKGDIDVCSQTHAYLQQPPFFFA